MNSAQVLFESSVSRTILSSPANAAWVGVLQEARSPAYEVVERLYFVALRHYRSQENLQPLPGGQEFAPGPEHEARQQAFEVMEQRRKAEKADASQTEPAVFVDPHHADESWPRCLVDPSVPPPPLHVLLGGRGRRPTSGLAMMRAWLGAPLLHVAATAAGVAALLHSNPVFAKECGFLGYGISAGRGQLISYGVPSENKLSEFHRLMTRYGLWRHASVKTVATNMLTGVVEVESTMSFDTGHIKAASGSVGVKLSGPKGKITIKKICRLTKVCGCRKDRWNMCPHAWRRTDDGAAVVVKGPTKIHWAHKVSVAAFAESEVPIDARVMQHAADHDGSTVAPHLRELAKIYPDLMKALKYVLADTAYHSKVEEVAELGPRLITPVKASTSKKPAELAKRLSGISHFTRTGKPVCDRGVEFTMAGRDVPGERYIWTVPDDEQGNSPCESCEFAASCGQGGARRHVRVDRKLFPRINWEHPQHLRSEQERYQRRTGVERAIKRIKVDLGAEHITLRNALQVQAVVDTKMMTLHLLLRAQARAA